MKSYYVIYSDDKGHLNAKQFTNKTKAFDYADTIDPSRSPTVSESTLSDDEEAEANARLIAAAPELLEALESLVDDCIHASGSMDYNYGEFDLKAAEAAILKAKGE